jgi:2'-5' RNA ligase
MSGKPRVVIFDKSQVVLNLVHYVKIVGFPGKVPVELGKVRDAILALQRKDIPSGIPRRLTFAMQISPAHHHCTVCFVDQDFSEGMIANIENYLEKWQTHPFDIVAKGLALFGQKKVILLEFTSAEYNELFQATSQRGTTEGRSVVRVPHVTYFDTDTGKGKAFIDKILSQL